MQLLFPSGLVYGVVKMDPFAMVRDLGLDDSETLTAVAAMKPQKYLVYIEHPLDIPVPKSRWCRYSMSPIASTLRVEDRKNGLLPDMVVPIFPNTQCSSEKRPPIRPTGSFPSSNCFHWVDNVTNIRVRRRQNGELFDDVRAVSLNGQQHVAIQLSFSDDYNRANELLSDDSASDDNASSASGSAPSRTSSVRSIPSDALHDPKVLQACSPFEPSLYSPPSPTSSGDTEASIPPQSDNASRRRAAHRPATPDADSSSSSSDTDLDDEVQQSTVGGISGLDLFGWDPDPAVPLIPLVDLWLELKEHICAEDLPSPLDWYKEEEEIVSIIMDAFARRSQSHSDAGTSSDSLSSSSRDEELAATAEPDHSASAMPTKVDQTAPQPRSKPHRVLHKVGSGARWVSRRTAITSRIWSRAVSKKSRPLL